VKKSSMLFIVFVILLMSTATVFSASSVGSVSVSADEAINLLMAGNNRFVSESYSRPDIGQARIAELSNGQYPFAVIVACSDSRVAPELLFDQGLGDLFVIRTAGNIIDDIAIGSVEYAVANFGVNLALVLGHDGCGAVRATIAGGKAEGHIDAIVQQIKPALATAKTKQGDLLTNTIAENIDQVVSRLQTSQPILANNVKSGKIKIVGGVYNLTDGLVTLRPVKR